MLEDVNTARKEGPEYNADRESYVHPCYGPAILNADAGQDYRLPVTTGSNSLASAPGSGEQSCSHRTKALPKQNEACLVILEDAWAAPGNSRGIFEGILAMLATALSQPK